MLLLRSSPADGLFPLADSGSDILHMASGDLDCKPLCEKEEEARAASTMQGTRSMGSRVTPEQAPKWGLQTRKASAKKNHNIL